MKKSRFLALVICLCLTIPYIYGGCAGGGGSDFWGIDLDDDDDGGDPCAGPVPCLTVAFGTTGYEFEDINGNPVLVLSDGTNVAVAAIYYDLGGDPYPIAFAGPVVSCHDGDFTEGYIDWNLSGSIDVGESLAAIDGEVNICNNTLTIYNLVVEGNSWDNYSATYVDSYPLSLGTALQQSTESQQKLLNELLKKMGTM